MDLSSILSGGKTANKEHFWALVIEPGWIQAGVWEIEGEKAKVISVSTPAPWEVEEEIIGAADTALSSAVQKLPEDIGEPSKTVFGVPPTWVKGGQIESEYLERIKKICSELSLEPTGFVVLPEAIAHLFKSEEGSPLNAVVIGIGDENIEITVFKLGNLIGNSSVARSVSISDDVIEGLARFNGNDALPSRILLYDGKEGELEEEKQTLLKLSWDEEVKVKFLHTPKIEIVSPERKVLATALAGASEIANVTAVEGTKKGFAEEEEVPPETANVTVPPKAVSPEQLGFAIGEDVSQKTAPPSGLPTQGKTVLIGTENLPPQKPGLKSFFSRLGARLRSLIARKPRTPLSRFAPNKNVFLIGAVVTAVLLVVGFIAWWYLPKATVSIYLTTKNLDEKVAVSFDTKATSSDFGKAILPGEPASVQVAGDKTKSTSGTKVVGDKARGSVKIQNGTAANINLTVGTILASSSDLKFAVVSAASVSAALSPAEPGTANVDVAAVDIGAQYNMGKDETLKVGNYPKAEVDAIVIADFSGGSSREISAVSTDDQTSLEADLTNELLDNAKGKLQEGLSADKYLIAETMTPSVDSKTFSNKVGDEATTLKLSLDLTVSAVVVDKKVLTDFAKEVLKDKIPAGYAVRDDQITYSFDLTGSKSGVYSLDATFGINLLPEVNVGEIAKNISGKYPNLADSYLTSIPGFARAEIKLYPPLPGRLGVLPRVPKNITIEVSAEK